MTSHFGLFAFIISITFSISAHGVESTAATPFAIEVVDDETGRGVPLVELRTVHGLHFVTDNNGLAAIDSPELMGQKVFFHVTSHGYEFPKDGFGYRGTAVDVAAGGSVKLKIKRINIAERLYRVTGAGLYRDTIRLGRKAPIAQPLLNAQVCGSDSVVTAIYQGKHYWFWGDTNRLRYPLGLFQVPGATSKRLGDGGLDPETGIDFTYFTGLDGFAKATMPMAGEGPTWLTGLSVVRDVQGNERMIGSYMKIRNYLEVYRRGLAQWNDKQQQFEHVSDIPLDAPAFPNGAALIHRDDKSADKIEYVYFGDPHPLIRVPARAEAVRDLKQYEAFTCLKPGARIKSRRPGREQLDRDGEGRLHWAWKKDAPPLNSQDEARLITADAISRDESRLQLRDAEGGKPVVPHTGNVAWNDYRGRWVMIALQVGGTSQLGEMWLTEADALEGPWSPARKIITHEKYSFYNPRQHPAFAKERGRYIFLEGTYTREFSGNPVATPLYDYNQVMYKVDLAHPRLKLLSR